jgi:hypothetical protein
VKRATSEATRQSKLAQAQEHIDAADRALRAFPQRVAAALADVWDDLDADLTARRVPARLPAPPRHQSKKKPRTSGAFR